MPLAAVAAVLWITVLGATVRLIEAGQFGRADFTQFIAIGKIAADGRYAELASGEAQRTEQRRYLSTGDYFPPVYGPAMAILFAPLARLPYVGAFAVWTVLSLVWVVLCLNRLLMSAPALRTWRPATFAAVAAFPPLLYSVAAGQLAAIALAGFTVFADGQERRSTLLSGLGLGILSYKPSLYGPVLVLCLVAREWRLALAAVGWGALFSASVMPIVGVEPLLGYMANLAFYAQNAEVIAKPLLMASLRTCWPPALPTAVAAFLYLSAAALVVIGFGREWRRVAHPLRRTGLLALATLLITPHAYFYDMLVLLPAFVAAADTVVLTEARQPALRRTTVIAFFSPLLGLLMPVLHFQPVTLVLVAWAVMFATRVGGGTRHARPEGPEAIRECVHPDAASHEIH